MSWGSFLICKVTELIPASLQGPVGGFPEMVQHAGQGLRKRWLAPPGTPAEDKTLFQGPPRVARDGRCHSSRHRAAGIVTRAVCIRFAFGEQNRNRGLLLTLPWVGSCSPEENTQGQPGREPTRGRLDRREGRMWGTPRGHWDQVGMTRRKHSPGCQPV